MHLKFKHEMSVDNWHRIVETISNTEGPWALYEAPAFLEIDNRVFSALTSYYSGIKSSYPPIETVFEMLTHETEHGFGLKETKSKIKTFNKNGELIKVEEVPLHKEDFLGLPVLNDELSKLPKPMRARKEKGEVQTLEGWSKIIKESFMNKK